jgi:hypothetical protein
MYAIESSFASSGLEKLTRGLPRSGTLASHYHHDSYSRTQQGEIDMIFVERCKVCLCHMQRAVETSGTGRI